MKLTLVVLFIFGLCAIGLHEEMQNPGKCTCVLPKAD